MAKPPGSLGRLEDLAVQHRPVQGRLDPRVERVRAYVFAGDHGLNAEGVSAYPSAVTAAMVATFLAGRASVNALASGLRGRGDGGRRRRRRRSARPCRP